MSAPPFSPGSPTALPGPSLVLVVEDDKDTRSIIRQALVASGHFVVEAEDGIAAQERVREQLPDLIVLDVMMPRMTGIEFVKWFRDSYAEPFVPVLMLTALGDVDHKVEGLSGGADDYQVKPFNYRELQARVQALLRIRTLTNELYRRTKELEAANAKLSEMQTQLIAKERELVAVQMAGAAAHNLGQPLTTVLLHCRVLEKAIGSKGPEDALQTVKAIQAECEAMRQVMAKLKTVDAQSTTEYVGATKILDLEKGIKS